jgi:ABC-type amino acid transport substrate-binding protein
MKTILLLAAAATAALAAATPAAAQTSANPRATASARLIKPLTLTRVQDLNFGTIIMGTLSGNETVSLSQTGALTCGSSGNLSCGSTGQVAQFTVNGTQGQVVLITASAPSFPLSGSNGGTLNFVPNMPGSLTLGNSGAPGNTFNVGGSIVIAANQADGVYTGQFDIQVSYQ